MRVLITGAGGHLGSTTVKILHEAGIDVVATDKKRRSESAVPIRIVNLLHREACYGLVEDIDVVVHLGAYPGPGKVDDQTTFNENTAMTMNIFQAAIESGCRKLIFASSIQAASSSRARAFGDKPIPASTIAYLPMDGNLPAQPGNTYALSKQAGEIALKYYARMFGAACVAIRFPAIIPKGELKRIADHLKSTTNRSHRHLPPLDEGFAFLSTDDCAKLIKAIVESDLSGYRCYAPAARAPMTRLTVGEIIEKYFDGVELRRPAEQINSMFDISGITEDTGWEPKDGLD